MDNDSSVTIQNGQMLATINIALQDMLTAEELAELVEQADSDRKPLGDELICLIREGLAARRFSQDA